MGEADGDIVRGRGHGAASLPQSGGRGRGGGRGGGIHNLLGHGLGDIGLGQGAPALSVRLAVLGEVLVSLGDIVKISPKHVLFVFVGVRNGGGGGQTGGAGGG